MSMPENRPGASVVLQPTYYKGYVIQPTPNGFIHVYDRKDTSKPKSKRFTSAIDAFAYVDEITSKRKR